eukprot:1176965-Prorocentrum_minimum.AAC.2
MQQYPQPHKMRSRDATPAASHAQPRCNTRSPTTCVAALPTRSPSCVAALHPQPHNMRSCATPAAPHA